MKRELVPPELANKAVHEKQCVVDYYSTLRGLEHCELQLFEKYVPEGSAVLDLGVGAGRTTPWLAARSASYLGIDYAASMVDVCRRRFPHLSFRLMDATDLSEIDSGSIDVAVFSFNGLDYLHPRASRARCLREIARVLAPEGTFIFSGHNARRLVVWPKLANAGVVRGVWRIVRSFALTMHLCFTRPFSPVFRHGHGYVKDRVHGGMLLHAAIPERVSEEFTATGFELVECLGVEGPPCSSRLVTPWYYFVVRKTAVRRGLRP